ncbi:ATPase, partial [Caulobacter sp. D5]
MRIGGAKPGRTAKAGLSAAGAARMRAARSSQAYVRVVILAALLLLAVYTALGVVKLQKEAAAPPGGAALAAQAQILSGKVETNLAAQRAGLSAAGDLLERDPTSAMDAAETALRAAGGEAMAVAVATTGEVMAVA